MRATVCESASDSPFRDATDASTKRPRRLSPFPTRTGQLLSMDLHLSACWSANRNLDRSCTRMVVRNHFSPAISARNNRSFDWFVIGEKKTGEKPGGEPASAECYCTKLKCDRKRLIITEISVEAAGVELITMLTARKLLIPGSATRAKKASLPDPLYVYCTKMLPTWSPADPHSDDSIP